MGGIEKGKNGEYAEELSAGWSEIASPRGEEDELLLCEPKTELAGDAVSVEPCMTLNGLDRRDLLCISGEPRPAVTVREWRWKWCGAESCCW